MKNDWRAHRLFDCFTLWFKSCRITASIQRRIIMYEIAVHIEFVLSCHELGLFVQHTILRWKTPSWDASDGMRCVRWITVLPHFECNTLTAVKSFVAFFSSSFFFYTWKTVFGCAHFKSTWCLFSWWHFFCCFCCCYSLSCSTNFNTQASNGCLLFLKLTYALCMKTERAIFVDNANYMRFTLHRYRRKKKHTARETNKQFEMCLRCCFRSPFGFFFVLIPSESTLTSMVFIFFPCEQENPCASPNR